MNEYQIASLCGLTIAALWVMAYLLCWCGQWAWAWMDDAEVSEENLIIGFLARQAGYTSRDSSTYWYYTANRSSIADGTWVFFRALLITTPLPLILVLSIDFYPVALALLTLIALAWVARFSRRHKKLFDKHIKDKDAHN